MLEVRRSVRHAEFTSMGLPPACRTCLIDFFRSTGPTEIGRRNRTGVRTAHNGAGIMRHASYSAGGSLSFASLPQRGAVTAFGVEPHREPNHLRRERSAYDSARYFRCG